MQAIRLGEEVLIDAPAAEFWPLACNTDRVNRALGLAAVAYGQPPEGSLTRTARMRLGPVALEWDEPPFEWVERQFYSVRRRFSRGPFAELNVGLRLAAEGPRTRVTVFTDLTPRGALGGWVSQPLVRKSLRAMVGLCRGIEAALKDRSLRPFVRPGPAARGLRRDRLLERVESLPTGVREGLRQRLRRHLAEAYDEEVVRMRPFALADDWAMPRLDVLRAFLHGAKAGLLDVSWEVLCPNCRVSKAGYASLSELKAEAHCETCGVVFGADFASNVEVRFTVNPAIRVAQDAVYCLAGPGKTPHRAAQVLVTPGGERALRLELGNRRYHLRSLKGRRRLSLVPQSQEASLRAAFKDGEPAQDVLAFRPGEVELSLANAGPGELWIALDEEAWSEQGATAAAVTALQEFRDLFAAEVLSTEQSVSVRHLALVFTDLKDSTAMYERIGDARAYALVRTHFKILTEAVRARDGAVVKTIGDAVMAVFATAEDAFAASLDIQAAIERHNAAAAPDGRILVKLGLHAGPSIAVNSNDALDYFGTTVNVAARVQAQSEGGDIVLSEAAASAAGVRELLKKDGGKLTEFTVPLKGLSEAFKLIRLTPAFGGR